MYGKLTRVNDLANVVILNCDESQASYVHSS